jgi:toxin FitB
VIIVDTNVISELMRPQPDPRIVGWVASQSRSLLYTTYINHAEILLGIAALPNGRRRAGLATSAEAMFGQDFAGRILPFGAAAAARYPEVMQARRRAGNPIGVFDALIAAIALAAGASVVTRDISGFAGCGLSLIDPWSGG